MDEASGARETVVRRAEPADYEPAAALLREYDLTLEGLREAFPRAYVASRGSAIVGCVAIEIYDGAALLRSLAVSEDERGRGLGVALTAKALEMAARLGAPDVYLLTETAEGFFPRFGFAVEDRAAAPLSVRESVEFRSACPKSAVMMHARVKP
jgi:amino-acid N-acetyltransferase